MTDAVAALRPELESGLSTLGLDVALAARLLGAG